MNIPITTDYDKWLDSQPNNRTENIKIAKTFKGYAFNTTIIDNDQNKLDVYSLVIGSKIMTKEGFMVDYGDLKALKKLGDY